MNVQAVKNYLAGTSGSVGTDQWFRHPLARGLLYSRGCQVLAENAGAFWLLDLIASHYGKLLREVRDGGMIPIKLEADGERGAKVVLCLVERGDVLLQAIPFTDFPRELLPFGLRIGGKYDDASNVVGLLLCLPCED